MINISYNLIPLLILSINTIATISYYIIYSNAGLKASFFKLPLLVQKLYVGLFVAPLFISPFVIQTKFSDRIAILSALGAVLSIIGFCFIILSFLKIGIIPSIRRKGGLSTAGVYSIVRHPIYAGTIITQTGLTLFNHSLISLLYIPLSVILYYIMASIEEKDLVITYGNEYLEYRKTVGNKIIPFVF